MKRILSLTISALAASFSLFAQGTDALPFTRIDRSPVLSGTAGAAITSSGDLAWTAFRNASVIPFASSKMDVAAGFQLWAPQTAKSTNLQAGAAYRFTDKMGLSLGVAYQRGLSYEPVDDNGAASGSYTPSDLVAALGFGIGFGEHFSLGVNARLARQALSPKDSFTGFSGDVMLLYSPLEALRLTAGVSTLGNSITSATRKAFPQPAHALVGAGYELGFGTSKLDAHLSGEYYFSGNFGVAAGLQYSWNDMVFVRAGYRFASEYCVIPSHLALGIGAKFAGVHIDLSYLTTSKALGNTLNIGLGYSF